MGHRLAEIALQDVNDWFAADVSQEDGRERPPGDIVTRRKLRYARTAPVYRDEPVSRAGE